MSSPFFLSPKHIRKIQEKFPNQATYVYSQKILQEQINSFLSFPSAFGHTTRYALKANSHKKILHLFNSCGLHFDASSEFEYKRLIKNGIEPQKIQVSTQQLPYIYRQEIFKQEIFNACSLSQLEEYGKTNPNTKISIRINPGIGSGSHEKTNVGGLNSSFGIWFEYHKKIKNILQKYKLTLTKIHSHIGSGSDAKISYLVAEKVLNYAYEHFPNIQSINLGGGFKVARLSEETSTCIKNIGEKITPLFQEISKKFGREIKLEIEPGTALVAQAGNLICRVDDIAQTGTNDKKTFIKLNTGMDTITRPMLYNTRHPIQTTSNNKNTQKYILVGHCCESGDRFSPYQDNKEIFEYQLPKLNIGDTIIIGGVGAYCQSMSLKGYNSFPSSPEFWLDEQDNLSQISKSFDIDDYLSKENG